MAFFIDCYRPVDDQEDMMGETELMDGEQLSEFEADESDMDA